MDKRPTFEEHFMEIGRYIQKNKGEIPFEVLRQITSDIMCQYRRCTGCGDFYHMEDGHPKETNDVCYILSQ